MTIYLSLPITGYDLDERRRLAEAARLHLMAEHPGAEVRIPFDIAGQDKIDFLVPADVRLGKWENVEVYKKK